MPFAEVNTDGYFTLELPQDSKFLTFLCQFNTPKMFFVVGVNTPLKTFKYRILQTGTTGGGDLLCMPYLGTVVTTANDSFHLFDAN
jgi:hypothetical protein